MQRSQASAREKPKSKRVATIGDSTGSRSLEFNSLPVSLLWAHQLRRENALLLARMDGLAKTVGKVQPHLVKSASSVKKVGGEIRDLKSDNEKTIKGFQKELQAVGVQVQGFVGEVKKLGERADIVDNRFDKVLKGEVEERFDEIEKRVEELLEVQKSREDVVLVKDSMEGIGRLMKRRVGARESDIRKMPYHEQNTGESLNLQLPGYNSGLRATQEEEAEKDRLLSLHDKETEPAPHSTSESVEGDLDLDENFQTISYAGHNPHRSHNSPHLNSLVMLPESDTFMPSQASRKPICNLRQGRFQSWQEYLLEGELRYKQSPRRLEGQIIEEFVRGIYNEEKKNDCETWLDERSWIWENIKGFDVHLSEVETQASVEMVTQGSALVEVSKNVECPDVDEQNSTRAAYPRSTDLAARKVAMAETIKKAVNSRSSINYLPNQLRRSQRLAQVLQQSLLSRGLGAPDKVKGTTHQSNKQPQVERKNTEIPTSYQPGRKSVLLNKKLNVSVQKAPAQADRPEVTEEDRSITPVAQVLPQPDERTPYNLPPNPTKLRVEMTLPAAQGAVVFPTRTIDSQGRNRKRDYSGQLLRDNRRKDVASDDFAMDAGELKAEVGKANHCDDTHLSKVLEKKNAMPGCRSPSVEDDIGAISAMRPIFRRNARRYFERNTVKDGDGMVIVANKKERTEVGMKSVEITRTSHENDDTVALPAGVRKRLEPELPQLPPIEGNCETRKRRGRRMPPEIPILSSTPSEAGRG